MLKKYAIKFVSDVLPSVIATIVGAYIVNHYIATKPEPPVAAAVEVRKADDSSTVKADAKSGDAPAETASLPDPVKSKAATDKSVADKSADKLTAKHPPAPRDRAAAKAAAPTSSASSATAAPVTTTASIPSTTIEPGPATEDRRGAADLARAAIDRLRATSEPARPDTARIQESSKPQEPSTPAAPIQPLPPAVTIAAPAAPSIEQAGPGVNASMSSGSSYSLNSVRDDPRRPSPPAEIPLRPIDLHAEAAAPARTTVAEDVLSAAKSVFHAVLPR
jgi:hypothetical protein